MYDEQCVARNPSVNECMMYNECMMNDVNEWMMYNECMVYNVGMSVWCMVYKLITKGSVTIKQSFINYLKKNTDYYFSMRKNKLWTATDFE